MRLNLFRLTSAALAISCVLIIGGCRGCSKGTIRTEGATPTPKITETKPAAKIERKEESSSTNEKDPKPAKKPAEAMAEVPEQLPKTPAVSAAMDELSRIHFDFDEYTLRSDARKVLAENAEYLLKTNTKIRIEGHCDERGTAQYNIALGERRARSAYQYLIDLEIDPNRMKWITYGEEKPLDARHNEDAWAMNRRAEFIEILEP